MPSRAVPARLRRLVAKRAVGCGEYCRSQERFSPDTFSAEHVVPRSKGGTTEAENLALSCQGCNAHKYTNTTAIDPITESEVPLFHRRRDDWHEHFAWSVDFTEIVGLTRVGRATVDKLRLNRDGVRNLRHVLFALRKHPPADPHEIDGGE